MLILQLFPRCILLCTCRAIYFITCCFVLASENSPCYSSILQISFHCYSYYWDCLVSNDGDGFTFSLCLLYGCFNYVIFPGVCMYLLHGSSQWWYIVSLWQVEVCMILLRLIFLWVSFCRMSKNTAAVGSQRELLIHLKKLRRFLNVCCSDQVFKSHDLLHLL